MEIMENRKLELDELDEIMDTQKICVSDDFVIDMERFSHGNNSRISRSLSRKGIQRGNEKKIVLNTNANDRVCLGPALSPTGSSLSEKAGVVAFGSTIDHASSPQSHHHQITVATTGNVRTTVTETKCLFRRNSFRRTPTWAIDPKRVLIFFATLSSMGTIILIYFTLLNGQNANDSDVVWEQ